MDGTADLLHWEPGLTAEEALAYLYAHDDRERLTAGQSNGFDLRRVRRLLAELDDPQTGRVTVHVAGTKGKGSVAAMMASVLQAAGFRTGLYTSPHLCDFRERIRVDGQAISHDAFGSVVERVRAAAERYHERPEFGRLTTFELTTATAFVHLREAGVTAQVLETGMGGRLDATNVIPTPEMAVITPVSYDHREILGNRLSEIAGEKSGIIKPGGAVVSALQEPEARAVIARRCYQAGAVLYDLHERSRWQRTSSDLDGQRFHIQGVHGGWNVELPLLGEFQMENAATAALAFEMMRDRGVEMPRQALEDGLRTVSWPGRLQVVQRSPTVVLDGAHNGASAHRLADALRRDIPYRRLTIIVGVARDKDAEAIANALGSVADEIVVTSYRSTRSSDPDELARQFRDRCPAVRVESSVEQAIRHTLAQLDPEDALCITGSLYIVGEALEALGLAEQVLDLSSQKEAATPA